MKKYKYKVKMLAEGGEYNAEFKTKKEAREYLKRAKEERPSFIPLSGVLKMRS